MTHYEFSPAFIKAAAARWSTIKYPLAASLSRRHPNYTGMPQLTSKNDVNSFGYELAHLNPSRPEGSENGRPLISARHTAYVPACPPDENRIEFWLRR